MRCRERGEWSRGGKQKEKIKLKYSSFLTYPKLAPPFISITNGSILSLTKYFMTNGSILPLTKYFMTHSTNKPQLNYLNETQERRFPQPITFSSLPLCTSPYRSQLSTKRIAHITQTRRSCVPVVDKYKRCHGLALLLYNFHTLKYVLQRPYIRVARIAAAFMPGLTS